MWLAKIAVFALCCLADGFVLRSAWTGRQIVAGEIRRGYFEPIDGAVGLAMDDAIRPIFPAFLLTERGALGVPPGVSAIAPLAAGAAFELQTEAPRAPYLLIGGEGPVPAPRNGRQPATGEAGLTDARTLGLADDRLVLLPWDGSRPWRDDAARLAQLHDHCVAADAPSRLTVAVDGDQLRIGFGRCALRATLAAPAPTLMAALAGPDWVTIQRQPAWRTERWYVWPVLAAVGLKVAATWWGLGAASALASSGVLALAALWWPVPAMLTWPIVCIAGLLAAFLRAALWLLARLPRRWRVPAAGLGLAGLAALALSRATAPHEFPPILHAHEDRGQPDACAIIGYSTAGGASLRRNFGGLRNLLDDGCARCRDTTASLAAGGEIMDWARDAYCSSPPSFGANGQVIFWGAANDDFLWGVLSVARLFVIGQQTIDLWQRNQPTAIHASYAYLDDQVAAIRGAVQCATDRHARFLYLHDFLVTDLVGGRDPERAAMLARRRAAVEAAGGTFVDLSARFGDEVGIAWFNDYLHPSYIAHQRVAELVCAQPE
ncbi:MAG: hypothetical protein SF182_08630 [Deltaproteobacteria bacterium]|nr:hypothetical protein [Deltaproteobacteria bacterium]